MSKKKEDKKDWFVSLWEFFKGDTSEPTIYQMVISIFKADQTVKLHERIIARSGSYDKQIAEINRISLAMQINPKDSKEYKKAEKEFSKLRVAQAKWKPKTDVLFDKLFHSDFKE